MEKNKKILLIIENSHEMHKFYTVISLFNSKGYKVEISKWKEVIFKNIRIFDFIFVCRNGNSLYKKILKAKSSSPVIYLDEFSGVKPYSKKKNDAVMIYKNDHEYNFVNLFILLAETDKEVDLEISLFIEADSESTKKLSELLTKLNILNKVKLQCSKNELYAELRRATYYFSFYEDSEEEKVISAAKDRNCIVVRFAKKPFEIKLDEIFVDIADLDSIKSFLKNNFSKINLFQIENHENDSSINILINELKKNSLSDRQNNDIIKVSNL